METTLISGTEDAIEIQGKYIVSTRFNDRIRKELLRKPDHHDCIKVFPEGEIVFINDRLTLFKADGSATRLIDFDHVGIRGMVKIVKINKSMILIPKDDSPLWNGGKK